MTETQSLQIGIARLYIKDLSFEAPRSPQIFRENWRPEVKMDLKVKPRRIEAGLHEVSVVLTLEATEDGKVGFIVEVEQAGLFEVRGPEGATLDRALHVYCPSTLFPYARQVVDQQLVMGGFPPLMLAPVNFEALYAQRQQQETAN